MVNVHSPTAVFNQVQVRGTYVGLDGSAIDGSVTFTARATRLVDVPDLTIIIGRPKTANISNAGTVSVLLPATDDPDIGVTFTYQVTENFPGGDTYDIAVPIAAEATGIELATAGRTSSVSASSGDLLVTQAALSDPTSSARVTLATVIAAQITASGSVSTTSGPDIAATGDSLTAGAGDSGLGYPTALGFLLASYATPGTVRNLGVGGETSATIAGRVGGRPYLATVSGGSIPASGGVTVTLAGDDGSAVAPLLQDDVTGSRGTNPVDIAGVRGTLTVSGGVYTFTRTTTGSAVAAPRAVPVITDAQRNRRGDITIMWWGQNDGTTDATTIIARQQATVRELKVARSRYLVLGLSTGSESTRSAMDAQFLAAHGRRFINIRKYLASTATLADAGITPTTQDNTDIAAGTVPTSFMFDTVHLTHAGYGRVARAILDRIQEFGWDDKWGAAAVYTPTVYFSDTFNRANATDLLGTTTPVGAKTWIASGTLTMPLTSNAAGLNVTSAEGFALANGGVSDGVLKATVRAPGDAGRPQLVARYLNQNNCLFIDGSAAPSKYRIRQRVNSGTTVDIATNLGGLTPTAGDVIEWTLNGTATVVKINGTQVYSGTIPTITSGFYYGFYGFPSSQTNLLWDDIALTDIPPA